MIDIEHVQAAIRNAQHELLARRNEQLFWTGELSSSALSTATATFALLRYAKANGNNPDLQQLVFRGVDWVIAAQNKDGGWGDTSLSFSNVSTTVLCWALLKAVDVRAASTAIEAAEVWLASEGIGTSPETLASTISQRYGSDKTFSVPILTMLALTGRLGPDKSCWRYVMQLPFEFAVLPNKVFPALRLPVVSYAIPALIAIGFVKHRMSPTVNPVIKAIRNAAVPKVLDVLQRIQPASGGFLEAAPLTSFVVMSLIAAGMHHHPVVNNGISFLIDTVRADGSWPIDTDLSSWVTSLAVTGLLDTCVQPDQWTIAERNSLVKRILGWQYKDVHPFTQSPPGGWAWTERSGGVPDADDTPAALIALHMLGKRDSDTLTAVDKGIQWLCGIQNTDGGIPTFCRGWGTLPFDRSSPDLTAHTLQAVSLWREHLSSSGVANVDRLSTNAIRYLKRSQGHNGSWSPLWFGNQHCPNDENPVYGTAKVLIGLAAYSGPDTDTVDELRGSGLAWLMRVQNQDGSWGGAEGCPGSVEETSMAIKAILQTDAHKQDVRQAATRGVAWLLETTAGGRLFPAAPIGLYFARLWYFEREYPLVHICGALGMWMQSNPHKEH